MGIQGYNSTRKNVVEYESKYKMVEWEIQNGIMMNFKTGTSCITVARHLINATMITQSHDGRIN